MERNRGRELIVRRPQVLKGNAMKRKSALHSQSLYPFAAGGFGFVEEQHSKALISTTLNNSMVF